MNDFENYLKSTPIIDWQHPDVLARARDLAQNHKNPADIARSCFLWVRDSIKHCQDFQIEHVTCSASEALNAGAGICFAKSHLLAAMLRANNIPAGFCYQRLSRDDNGAPFCLHGFNAVYLSQIGWYRIDPRGNRSDVDAQFTPPIEKLAFTPKLEGEIDFPDIFADPLPEVVRILKKYASHDQVWDNLPDLLSISE